MKANMTALMMAALMAMSGGHALAEPVETAQLESEALSAQVAQALASVDRALPPGGLAAPDAPQVELDGARMACVQDGTLLYIDASGALVRRAQDGELALIEGAHALTHVDADSAYALVYSEAPPAATSEADSGQGAGWDVPSDSGQGAGWDVPSDWEQGAGWDDPIEPTGNSAPLNGRELSAKCDWVRVALDGSGTQVLLEGVGSVPVISGGYAYATAFETGDLMRSDLSGAGEPIYSPGEGRELKLSACAQGAICALYDQGILVGCCTVYAQSAVAVPDWTVGAEFYDGYALSYAPGGDGSGREGLYLVRAQGEVLLDAHARADFLCLDGMVYFWHADPEQPYGFCDLMACDPLTGEVQAVPAGAQLRARLCALDGALFITNYDSELYALPEGASEPEFALDLSVDYDFNSDLMPLVTLYGTPEAPGALIYLDEGQGYRLIGEIAPET